MLSAVGGNVHGIWPISQIDTVDVDRDSTLDVLEVVSIIFRFNRGEVAHHVWVSGGVLVQDAVKEKDGGLMEKPFKTVY